MEHSPFEGEQGNLFRRNSTLSTTFSELPMQCNLCNFPLMVCNLPPENEILCPVFNLSCSKCILNMVNSGVNTQSPKDRNDGLLPSHSLNTQFPFFPPLKMWNHLLSSSWKGKAISVSKKVKDGAQKWRQGWEWFSFPFSSWTDFTREGCTSQHSPGSHPDWGKIWSSWFWPSGPFDVTVRFHLS